MKNRVITFVSIAALSVCFMSCQHQLVLKSTDIEMKYKTAMQLYDQKDYYRALQLFDQLVPLYKGNARNEDILFKYAFCYMNQNDFILAAYYFKRFATTFPYSDYAEEASYNAAFCYYKNSPIYSLDQTDTDLALKELQVFARTYPKSSRMENVNKMVDELRGKLEKKAYEIAKLYYRMEKYNATITSLNVLLSDFPDTQHYEYIMVMKINSLYDLAVHSVYEKQEERLQMVINEYKDFIEIYPKSKYLKEVTDTYNKALTMLSAI